MTEKTSVTAPKAETPTWATPPDTLPTPLVMSLACSLNVSSESLPPLMKLPRSLCLALSTICGQVVAESAHGAADRLRQHQRRRTPMTITIASTSTVEHSPRLQPSRRSIAVTTGERTATLKTETKITSRTFAIDASAHATATTPATSRIVRTDIETSTSDRRVRVPAGDGSATIIASIVTPERVSGRHAYCVTHAA